MSTLAVKRMVRERQMLQMENDDYFAFFHDDNLLSFDAYVVGPDDSLYKHKLVKLHFDIPHNYPMVPPKVKFVQHTGTRLHPNLYVEGKVCLSILGTWQGEPWTFSMNCNTVLITIRSLLDNKPYLHEPGQNNNPEFNQYVQYCSWKSLLFDYVRNESDAPAKAFLHKFVASRGPCMVAELKAQQAANSRRGMLSSPYLKGQPCITPDYAFLVEEVESIVKQATELHRVATAAAAATAAASTTAASTAVATVVPTPAIAPAPALAAEAASAPEKSTLDGSQKQQSKRPVSAVTGADDEDHEAPTSKRVRNKSGDVRDLT